MIGHLIRKFGLTASRKTRILPVFATWERGALPVDLRHRNPTGEERMGKRERYEPGAFCWVDLSTSDADGAKAFYGELFGWEFEDSEIPGGVYAMCHVRGDAVAAIVQQDEQPGHWNNYVAVISADGTAAKAKQLGATVFEEPFDVMEAGRMAVFADPSGAVLCAWQPRGHVGAGRVNDPGCLSLNQLNTRDPQRAAEFYEGLFGWEIEQVADEPPYFGINNKGWLNGGIMKMPDDAGGTPSHWLGYFTAEDADAAAKSIAELGGTVMVPPMRISAEGRICVARDPQGAVFALFEGRTDD
jgi:predicted enzyme related to lactoylglutathione lyase